MRRIAQNKESRIAVFSFRILTAITVKSKLYIIYIVLHRKKNKEVTKLNATIYILKIIAYQTIKKKGLIIRISNTSYK